jgi:hypothetical protein
MDGFFNDSALVKIIRLTIETNLLTSKYTSYFFEANIFTHVSATVGIVSLVVILVAPVSDP